MVSDLKVDSVYYEYAFRGSSPRETFLCRWSLTDTTVETIKAFFGN